MVIDCIFFSRFFNVFAYIFFFNLKFRQLNNKINLKISYYSNSKVEIMTHLQVSSFSPTSKLPYFKCKSGTTVYFLNFIRNKKDL